MAKKTKRKKLVEQLDNICKQIIYIRDEACCQVCGKPVEGTDAHTSHIIPRSKGNNLRWNLLNLMLKCFYHHINWWHKNPLEAIEWFKGKFPARYDYLMKHKEEVVKFSTSDLENRLVELKIVIETLEVKDGEARRKSVRQ